MSIRWPRVLTPNQLSQIIKKQKNPVTALHIFEEAKERYPGYGHNGLVYATMIGILGKSGHITEMKHVIERMKEDSCECKDSVFVSAIQTFARAGRLDEGISLFKSLQEFNCVDWTLSFNTLLQEMVKESRLEAACSIFLKYSYGWEVKSRIKSLNLLMEVLCQINRSDLASHIFQEMNYQGCYPERESYRILMAGLCNEGKLSEATHLLYSMFWRISQKGAGEDIVVYRILLDSLCDSGEFDMAIEILGKILRKGLKAPKRYHLHIDPSRWDKSEAVEGMKRLITEALVQGAVPSLASYSSLAADLYNEGRFAEGDKVLQVMQGKGFQPTPLVYEAKTAALCRAGRAEEAMAIIDHELMGSQCVPTVGVYNILMKGLCAAGKSMVAVGYLRKMPKQAGCVAGEETYETLVGGLCRDGKFPEASQIMEEMLRKSHLPRAETYNLLIKGLCAIGKQYEAVMWLEEMVSQDMVPKSFVWNSLAASVCCAIVDTSEILEHLVAS